jgi:hypothetical protein
MAETANFDGDATGSSPSGWQLTMTGSGHHKWTVEKDDTAPSRSNVLQQSGTATYPLALKDGFAEIKFKAVSGSQDRAGGLVWRARDANNYYVVRANALEDNVVLYKTVNGKRSSSILLVARAATASRFPYQLANGTSCASTSRVTVSA